MIIGAGGMIGINAILLLTARPDFSVRSVQGFVSAVAFLMTAFLLYRAIRLAVHTLKTTRVRQELAAIGGGPKTF